MLPGLLPSNRLPTLREVDSQQESSSGNNMAAVASLGSRELQQHQLQQQQQQYAILLAQAAQAAQQQLLANFSTNSLPSLGHGSFFQLPPAGSPLALNPASSGAAVGYPSPNATSYATPFPSGSAAGSPPPPSNGCGYHGNGATPTSNVTFILPLGDSDQSGSHDSGLGSGSGPASACSIDVIRRLQLIGEDSSGGGASVNSLLSSDSDRQRMDSSVESMASQGGRNRLPSLHQQLENMRIHSVDNDDARGAAMSGTLRRNGPFITRSTSEKVPHRNEILAQVQRTAWARHTTK